MKKSLLLLMALFVVNSAFAEAFKITPTEKISTSTKNFQEGNVYQFKKINTDEIINGTVVFYRPNGVMGQEAQIEISNFRDKNNVAIPGKITIIPKNHKNFQEFMNYFSMSCFWMVRGSEIALLPDIHTFEINNEKELTTFDYVQIKPAQEISTLHDEIEVGDSIKFITTTNSYNIKVGTPIYGIVDYVDENGWGTDNAAIYFKKFITKDKNGKQLVINSNLEINGFEILKYKSGRTQQFFNYMGVIFRGKEVDIRETDVDIKFNLLVK